jgi:carboxypeptidase Q
VLFFLTNEKIYYIWYMLKSILLSVVTLASGSVLFAQSPVSDSFVFSRISGEILDKATCYKDLEILCKTIGHRISGSSAAAKAVTWGFNTLKAAGCDKVYMQPVMVPHWVRGKEEFKIKLYDGQEESFHPLGLGNSLGTNGVAINAPIIMATSEEDLKNLGTENIAGKIVFFNHAWNQKVANPFEEYGGCVFYRWAGPSLAAKYGAIACIVRSAGSGLDDFAHTGSMRYDSAYNKIPAMAISYKEAIALAKLCADNKVKMGAVSSTSQFEADVLSYNVIGEITGSEYPNEIITVGGHLDSWDVGEGAHDDGAGVVQSIEVVRTLKKLNLRPMRTIRCVLFMNEENGLRGGTEYARLAKLNNENHLCAIETDAGGFSPRGFEMRMSEQRKQKVRSWIPLFYPYGVYEFTTEGGGADIGPLQRELNTPLMGLFPDPQRYFDLHHTNNDVFEQVHRRELCLGAVALAQMCYMLSEYGLD